VRSLPSDAIVRQSLTAQLPMRVFVAYGYAPNEEWVREFVVPVLEALDVEVITGERTRGERIDQVVSQRIESADALIGFLQRREPYADGKSWDTSAYVKDEIALAFSGKKPVIRFVEKGVKDPGGILQGHQHVEFVLEERDRLLVELTNQVRAWIQGTVSVQLGPKDLLADLELLGPGKLPLCHYTVRHKSHPEHQGQVPITGEGGGLYVRLVGFRPGRCVDLEIQTPNRTWWRRGVQHTHPFVTVDLK
jgi:hypothetical protein